MKRTPLFPAYENYAGVKLTDFGGWELPLHFSGGIIAEHMAVRTQAGLFDVSHMGEVTVEGPQAARLVRFLVTNDTDKMQSGEVLYSPMCYPDGGVIDDVIIYKRGEERFLLVVNAANRQKDYDWISRENPWMVEHGGSGDVTVRNRSDDYVQIALQGPKAEEILARLWPECSELEFFRFVEDVPVGESRALISQTGYTGEKGFELYVESEKGPQLWQLLIETGKDAGLVPCGLGARDTLRLEAKLPLYGHEIAEDITPLEANLSVFVSLDTADFCGKQALVHQKEHGIPRSLRGIVMEDKGVPRSGYRVFSGAEDVGHVTSGAKSPMLDAFIGLVLIKRGIGLKIGDTVEVDIHGKKKQAKLVKTPFYKRTGRKT
ncbi:MAG: glycine cleavage system aminomethyltransferase GcvT [Spirochaetota bacterium]